MIPSPFVYILDLRILASQNFLDKLNDFEFKRVRIITESSHFSDDEAVEVLLEAQNTVRSIENSHNTEEIIKWNASLDAFGHNVFLQQSWSVEFVKLRIRAAEEIGRFLRGVDK